MKLSSILKTIPLSIAINILSPQSLIALESNSKYIHSILDENDKDCKTIYLSNAIFLHGKISKIKKGENVYVLYQTKTKTGGRAGILLLGIPYNKKEMGAFQPAIIGGANGPFKVLIAPEGKKIPGTDNFSVYNIK